MQVKKNQKRRKKEKKIIIHLHVRTYVPSYPNNPQPSQTFAVKASEDIIRRSMMRFDAPYPMRQSLSISP